VTITLQRNRAKKVGGTTAPLMRKRIRSFEIGMRERKLWMNQYRKKLRRPADVIPAFSGRWFGKFLKLGQIAFKHC
jgi:hypothetical protein